MANASILAMKEQHVAEIKDRLTRAQSVVMFDYRGLTVDEVTALRVEMRKAGVEYIVLKNTMVERACRELNIDESVHAMLKGPSAFASVTTTRLHPQKSLRIQSKSSKNAPSRAALWTALLPMLRASMLSLICPQRGSHRPYAGQHDEPHHRPCHRSRPARKEARRRRSSRRSSGRITFAA